MYEKKKKKYSVANKVTPVLIKNQEKIKESFVLNPYRLFKRLFILNVLKKALIIVISYDLKIIINLHIIGKYNKVNSKNLQVWDDTLKIHRLYIIIGICDVYSKNINYCFFLIYTYFVKVIFKTVSITK